MKVGTKVITKVECCGIPVGTKGTISADKGAVTPEMLQVKFGSGGALYYLPKDLETV